MKKVVKKSPPKAKYKKRKKPLTLKEASEKGITFESVEKGKKPLTIKGRLNPAFDDRFGPIEFKISMRPWDLTRFYYFLLYTPVKCADQILKLIEPSAFKWKKPAFKFFYTFELKIKASRLYALFAHLSKKQFEECPSYFQKLIEHIKTSDPDYRYSILDRKERINSLVLTIYYIEKRYNSLCNHLSSLGIDPFNDDENFYITYVVPFLKNSKSELKRYLNALSNKSTEKPFGWDFLIEDIERFLNNKPPLFE